MSVRDPSRRKALKYGVMAALGLGAGVALGEVTGANRLVHAASPPGSDPVFSGTGIQFPSLTSDPSQLVGNMWYRSDLTAMKYSDGTNAHELATLDIANTWTGVQTFNANPVLASGIGITWGGTTGNIGSATAYPATIFANALTAEGTTPTISGFGLGTSTAGTGILDASNVFTAAQTFNGGIVFNAAGSIASTSTYIEADGAGGSIYINVPSNKAINFYQNNISYLAMNAGNFYPTTDATGRVGYPAARFASMNALLFNVYHASGASFPTAQLADGALNFGTGLVATDTQINRAAAGGVVDVI